MSAMVKEIASMVALLPDTEQRFAFEFVKRLVLAWDIDFTKLTPAERLALDEAENGEYIDQDAIDWDNLQCYL